LRRRTPSAGAAERTLPREGRLHHCSGELAPSAAGGMPPRLGGTPVRRTEGCLWYAATSYSSDRQPLAAGGAQSPQVPPGQVSGGAQSPQVPPGQVCWSGLCPDAMPPSHYRPRAPTAPPTANSRNSSGQPGRRLDALGTAVAICSTPKHGSPVGPAHLSRRHPDSRYPLYPVYEGQRPAYAPGPRQSSC
jgi:hypothetical protein